MKLFKKAKKGFTLVELVVVIAVIAVLAAVSVGAYFGVTESANQSKCDQEAKAFHTALILIANDPNDLGASFDEDNNVVVTNSIETSIQNQLGYSVDVIVSGEKESDNTTAKVVDGKFANTYKGEVSFNTDGTYTYGSAGKTAKINIKTGAKENA